MLGWGNQELTARGLMTGQGRRVGKKWGFGIFFLVG